MAHTLCTNFDCKHEPYSGISVPVHIWRVRRTFGMVEIAGNQLYFQIVSRTGDTVDSGVLPLLTQR